MTDMPKKPRKRPRIVRLPDTSDPAQERGERIETGKMIARGGKSTGHVSGATPAAPGPSPSGRGAGGEGECSSPSIATNIKQPTPVPPRIVQDALNIGVRPAIA